MMTVDIITIGDELLIGQTVDTNSAWMASELNKIGMAVRQITSISDTAGHITAALDESLRQTDVVLITGGLGPTKDDVTKHTLATYFDAPLEINQEVLNRIEQYFKKNGIPVLDANRSQAELPKGCEVIENKLGTASGMWFEKERKIVVAMPGVPYEMKGLMKHGVLPKLSRKFQLPSIIHCMVYTCGMGESKIAEKISEFESGLSAEEIKLAYLPSPGSVKLRLSASGTNRLLLEQKLNAKVNELKSLIPDIVVGVNIDSLESVVGDLLRSRKATLGIAESFTGGRIAANITRVPGASDFLNGGVVAYQASIKSKVLGVPQEIIGSYGVVSAQVAELMAKGVANLLDADYAIASTGYAGPGGGDEQNPVGTIWLAISGKSGTMSKKFTFGHERELNIEKASTLAIDLLRRYILAEGV